MDKGLPSSLPVWIAAGIYVVVVIGVFAGYNWSISFIPPDQRIVNTLSWGSGGFLAAVGATWLALQWAWKAFDSYRRSGGGEA